MVEVLSVNYTHPRKAVAQLCMSKREETSVSDFEVGD